MSYLSTFLLIGGLYLLAAASPGPNFFVISQLAMTGKRREASSVAIGVALGSALWVAAAVAGLAALLGQFGHLATALRVGGAIYLVWYGARLLRSATKPGPQPANTEATVPAAGAGMRTGLITCLTNPKAAAFWTSVFATTLPAGAPLWFLVGVCLLITVLSICWHLGIVAVFSRRSLQAGYERARRPVEAACGGALIALGLRQALTQ